MFKRSIILLFVAVLTLSLLHVAKVIVINHLIIKVS